MGKATGKTFEEWLKVIPNGWSFVNQNRGRVLRRDADNTGTEANFTKRNGSVVEFTIPDSVHQFANPTGQDDFRRYALMVGGFIAQGGKMEDVTDPYHEDE